MLNYLLPFSTAFISSLLCLYFGSKLFYAWNILDNPKKYNKKRAPIPYGIWIIFFLCFIIASYFFVDYNYKLGLIWIFGFVITGLSFVDDLFDISAKVRLCFQIAIWAVIWITSIKIGYISNVFWGIIDLETYFITFMDIKIYLVPLLFTIIWYVFVFNALNWSDGISGNTSGISIISFFILFLLGLILFWRDNYIEGIKNAEFIMQISIILVGILIPYWYFDIKEKVLMWDSGTMFLGFMLATLAIIAGWKIATVLVVFWVYSVDAVYVIANRIAQKKSPLKWDFTHLHHRLEAVGLTHNQILWVIYSLCFFFWLSALFLDRTGKIIVFGIIIILVGCINKIVESVLTGIKKKK